MILLDVNVVLAAHRADHPQHALVRPWFDRVMSSDEPFTVPDVGWASFVRIATNRRIFTVPSTIGDAFAFLRAVRGQPHHVVVVGGERALALFEELCRDGEATGDLAADAFLAALTLEQGCELVTLDRDFARFPALRWSRPG